MRPVRFFLFCLCSLLVFSLLMPSSSDAQEVTPAITKGISIKKITPEKQKTPEYQLLKGQVMARTREWFVVNTIYETDPEWVDEALFTYYVVVKAKQGPQKYTLFKGDVTYVNIQKGKHKSDIYLHPSTLARYGDVERVAVVISVQGRPVAMESLPSSNRRWWEELPPVDGYLLNRMQTPFAMINFDDYEAIKIK